MDKDKVRGEMQEVYDLVAGDIASVRTGRAKPSIIENVVVSAYGGAQKLKIIELASVSASDAETIVIDPWDKSIIGEIKKGIDKANIGLTPQVDGEIIRIIIPPMTLEDRQKYVKLLSQKVENGRVLIRQVRLMAMKDIKNAFGAKEISEDENSRKEKEVQELTDEFIKKIEMSGEEKKNELLSV
ncbi:MAG: Ribosome-recycling factor [Candidatus Woesebacteria bacterium GW2011_GWB1_43_14]|uniref:Ribosome-recycling factor n=1 Tax=Candidatus Woesebacteria bacterium GW2011_GWB1_43_14 TaxID=1618578 RepID=A0A0G1FPJ7_9BACT|nr:MAG: Ribosome-recycling factor [Candidatus Woesebacteria bacterium GW2011_GWA1_39_11b]KKS77741.1 MAG: ribosome recycling factor, ribosome recycling factor [Candidatus Woesebacteria bacterium GW2011_GWC1_42_9]KKS96951.1 MAG: Ribosome-recycling factor [Candidatus Woesebacteria bacterium GW2011_GWB1_43_14]